MTDNPTALASRESSDTNKMAFARFKLLIQADSLLSDEIKRAVSADCSVPDPIPVELKKAFQVNDAASK